jgi:hypothetical protein
MVLTVAEVKGWRVEENWDYDEHEIRGEETLGVVKRLEENWKSFKRGGHQNKKKRDRKQRVLETDSDDSADLYP